MVSMHKVKSYTKTAGMVAMAYAALIPAMVGAESAKESLNKGIDAAGGPSAGDATSQVNGVIGTAVSILSWVVGIIAVIMIIVSGLRFILAGGDAGKVGTARNGIIYGLVGLVIVASAQTLVRFVLDATPTI